MIDTHVHCVMSFKAHLAPQINFKERKKERKKDRDHIFNVYLQIF